VQTGPAQTPDPAWKCMQNFDSATV